MRAPGTASVEALACSEGRRSGLLPQLLIAVLTGGYATGAAFGWGSSEISLLMGDFGLSGAALAACLSCLRYAKVAPGCGRPAWMLFALSSAMVAAGNGVWGWYEVVLGVPVPRTSLADFCFLFFAPPAIIGLLVLAKRPATKAGWTCLVLDASLIGGSLLTLTWSLALARAAEWDGRSTARIALCLAYPVLDIMLVSMVLALHFRRSSVNRATINTALAALALTVLCDALFTSPLLREHYHSGQILDAGWFASSLLLSYAPWIGHSKAARQRALANAAHTRNAHTERKAGGAIAALTPYLAAAVCTLAILYNIIDGRKTNRVVLVSGCAVALILVVRQGIMLLDNISLAQELAHKESHFRSLVQGSSDVIMIVAPTGILRYVSPAAQGVYGRDAEDMIGTELATHIHPEDLGRVLHEVRRFLATPSSDETATRIECRIRSGDGGWLHVESTVNRYQGGLIFNSRDITERVQLQAQLQHNASHDPLTDLPNRALFTERVGQVLGGRRTADGDCAVLFIDLDGFKTVNDTIGHQAGDELLVQVGRRLAESVRAEDTAARLGGDEFAALICARMGDQRLSEQQIREIADRLRLTLSAPYTLSGQQVKVAASIGIAFAEPGTGPAELMRNADLAMYRAKASGKNRVELYAPQMQADVMHRAELAARLRSALRDGEFTLLHQPVVDLGSGQVNALEAHARWRSAQGILFTPAEFLRITGTRGNGNRGAEGAESDRHEVSRWLLEEAVMQAADRHRTGHAVPVAVRMPTRHLMSHELPVRTIEALLGQYELPPGGLVVALTEHDPGISLDELERRLAALRRLGVRIALDGFGAGYAAMAALRRLPVDVLRLDRSFTEGLGESARLHKITAGLLHIAQDLGLSSVADGVDRPEQLVVLREMGCTHGQGLAFSGPLDEHRLRVSLARGRYPLPQAAVSAGGSPSAKQGQGGEANGGSERALLTPGRSLHLPVRRNGSPDPEQPSTAPM
jgi:diguanylate cyclase (GGDEF)-like protein/PAS domain S-box-containing protein